MERFDSFEVGKTYIFWSGSAHFRGKVLKRTAKTITVRLSDEALCHLYHLLYLEDAEKVAPIRMRITYEYANCEYAVTRKAGKFGRTTVTATADRLAREQM